MADLSGNTLLRSLKKVNWNILANIYGNNHSTIIGILVKWWISMSPNSHQALEGGPTNGYKRKGVSGRCDALLCENNIPVGVLEVEGSRHKATVKKIGYFFNSKYKELETLRFGILLFYTWKIYGRGENRKFTDAAVPEALQEVLSVSKKYPNKPLLIIILNKEYQPHVVGIRTRNAYYRGQVDSIESRLFSKGKETRRLSLYNNYGDTKLNYIT